MPEVNAYYSFDTCHIDVYVILDHAIWMEWMGGMPEVDAHHPYDTCHMGIHVILDHVIWIYM